MGKLLTPPPNLAEWPKPGTLHVLRDLVLSLSRFCLCCGSLLVLIKYCSGETVEEGGFVLSRLACGILLDSVWYPCGAKNRGFCVPSGQVLFRGNVAAGLLVWQGLIDHIWDRVKNLFFSQVRTVNERNVSFFLAPQRVNCVR